MRLLAQMLGSARQVVNKHLQVLKQEGIVNTQHHQWTVDDLNALEIKAGLSLQRIG